MQTNPTIEKALLDRGLDEGFESFRARHQDILDGLSENGLVLLKAVYSSGFIDGAALHLESRLLVLAYDSLVVASYSLYVYWDI